MVLPARARTSGRHGDGEGRPGATRRRQGARREGENKEKGAWRVGVHGDGRGGRKRKWKDREMAAAAAMGEDGLTAETWGGLRRWQALPHWALLGRSKRSGGREEVCSGRGHEIGFGPSRHRCPAR
jgi:hypothetical protein